MNGGIFINGDRGPFIVDESPASVDRLGVMTATVKYWASTAFMLSSHLGLSVRHPRFSSLEPTAASQSQGPGGSVYVDVTFEGAPPGARGFTEPIYELEVAVSEFPMEDNPEFLSLARNGDGNGINDARFNPDGTFKIFGPDAPAGLRGKSTYKAPTAIVREIKLSTVWQVGGLGTIDAPPDMTISLQGTQNYLLTGVRVQKRGNVYEITREWASSGPSPWPAALY